MPEISLPLKILLSIIPILFAVTLHEVAHGWVAKQLGDRTAEMMGRLTVNPVKHIDPVGTVVVPFVLYIFSGFIFGWAKPVPVNWNQLRNPKRDMALVALAGPAANLIMVLFWLVIAKLGIIFVNNTESVAHLFIFMAWVGVIINSLLMILNLFPIPPLDGSRVVFSILPARLASRYAMIEPYGLVILLVLFATGVLGDMLEPIIIGFQQIIYTLVF
jgi:Zn-dependent protease